MSNSNATQEELKGRLRKAWNLPHNQVCCDCGDKKPTWASIVVPPPGVEQVPMGAFCCFHCSGAHRRLGVHICFVRSITLDDWKEKEVLAMERGGNQRINLSLEATLPPDFSSKPNPTSDLETRDTFVKSKFQARDFFDPSQYQPGSVTISGPPPKAATNPMFDSTIFLGMSNENLFSESKEDLYAASKMNLDEAPCSATKNIPRRRQSLPMSSSTSFSEKDTGFSQEDLFSSSKEDLIQHFMASTPSPQKTTRKPQRNKSTGMMSRIDTMEPGESVSLKDEGIPPPFTKPCGNSDDFADDEVLRLNDNKVEPVRTKKPLGRRLESKSPSRRRRGRNSKSPVSELGPRRSSSVKSSRRNRLNKTPSFEELVETTAANASQKPKRRARNSKSPMSLHLQATRRPQRHPSDAKAGDEGKVTKEGAELPPSRIRKSSSANTLEGNSSNRRSRNRRGHSARRIVDRTKSEESLESGNRKGNAKFSTPAVSSTETRAEILTLVGTRQETDNNDFNMKLHSGTTAHNPEARDKGVHSEEEELFRLISRFSPSTSTAPQRQKKNTELSQSEHVSRGNGSSRQPYRRQRSKNDLLSGRSEHISRSNSLKRSNSMKRRPRKTDEVSARSEHISTSRPVHTTGKTPNSASNRQSLRRAQSQGDLFGFESKNPRERGSPSGPETVKQDPLSAKSEHVKAANGRTLSKSNTSTTRSQKSRTGVPSRQTLQRAQSQGVLLESGPSRRSNSVSKRQALKQDLLGARSEHARQQEAAFRRVHTKDSLGKPEAGSKAQAVYKLFASSNSPATSATTETSEESTIAGK